MLCFLCRKIQIKSVSSSWTLQHHLTFGDLTESADDGCELCGLFRTTLLHYYADEQKISVDAAEDLHWKLDDEDAGKAENDRRLFHVRLETIDMDERFGPSEASAHGITFLRKFPGDDYDSVGDVSPFVEFSVQADSHAALDGWIVGAEISKTPDLSLGKLWISECREKHTECEHMLEPQLPPRIIDVGPSDGSEMPRLMLCGGCAGDYAALSHCWGEGSKPMMTNSTTFSAHLEGIPYASLPNTFQHAVIVTRQLGLRYLWIDSLCIIQDSKDDWEQHCFEMPKIYRNAVVTIAGPGAVDCNTGFLHERRRPLSVNLEISNGEIDQQVTLSHSRLKSPFHPEPEHNSPLAKRAWVLQERLLSRRILYLGSEFMYFECFTNTRHEDLHYPFVDDYQLRGEVTKKSFTLEEDSCFWLQYWWQIVSTYSESALTVTSDRLPAISGVAREIQHNLRDEYCAGLWLKDIPRGLTWFNPFYKLKNDDTKDYNSCALPYLAPTWSWASSRHSVTILIKNYRDFVFISEDIQIIGVDIKLQGSNPLGEVQEGLLILRGRLQEFAIQIMPDRFVPGRQSLFICANKSRLPLGEYHPDDNHAFQYRKSAQMAPLELPFEQTITLLYLGYFKSSEVNTQWAALAVEAIVGTEDRYRRVGLAHGRLRDFPPIEDFFQESDMRLLKIV